MEKFFQDEFYSSVHVLDLANEEDPYLVLENYFRYTICQFVLKPAYDRGDFVLIHVYCTGHGYSNEKGESQILLNVPIAFCNQTDVFQNPYPIQDRLEYIFNMYANANILFIGDTCRDKNRFVEGLNPK